MTQPQDDTTQSGRRSWRKSERSKVSILQVFRAAHRDKTSRKVGPAGAGTNDPKDPDRHLVAQHVAVTEQELRGQLLADLNSLLNTTNLDAAQSLGEVPNVARSIANFGFRDLSGVAVADLNRPQITASIRRSLLDHEPRLIPDSLEVRIEEFGDGTYQKLVVAVTGEFIGDPVDLPLEFRAEVDFGAGKLTMSTRGQS